VVLPSALSRSRGRAEAEPLYQRALAIRERALGPEHPKAVETRNALSTLAVTPAKAPQKGD
jgi:Tetratricopeptide repeat